MRSRGLEFMNSIVYSKSSTFNNYLFQQKISKNFVKITFALVNTVVGPSKPITGPYESLVKVLYSPHY